MKKLILVVILTLGILLQNTCLPSLGASDNEEEKGPMTVVEEFIG